MRKDSKIWNGSPDIRKGQTTTGYSPRVDLDQALRLTRDWFAREFTSPQPAVLRYVQGDSLRK